MTKKTHTPIDTLDLTDARDAIRFARENVQALNTLLEALQGDTEVETPAAVFEERAAALACLGQRLCERATSWLDSAHGDLVPASGTPTQAEA